MSRHPIRPARADALQDNQLDQVSGGPTINQLVRRLPRRAATNNDAAPASGGLSSDPGT